jgi:hypothetical protein
MEGRSEGRKGRLEAPASERGAVSKSLKRKQGAARSKALCVDTFALCGCLCAMRL